MIELIRRLDRSRFEVYVACSHLQGAWLPRVEGCAPITEFPIQAFARASTLAQAAAFARWCRAQRIAVLHTCEFYSNIFALPVAAVAGVPIRIGSRREVVLDRTRSQSAVQRMAYRFASVVVTNARSAAGALAAEGVGHQRIEIIPNGVAIDLYRPRARSGEIRTILTVANLRAEKAHELLFEAAARLLPRYPALRFQVVGDGPRGGELRELATTLGIRTQVDFLGHREDVPALLSAADVFVLPSRSEALPNSVIEAMAAGLPVIATAVGGLVELIDDGRTGRLVAPDDPVALASALESLIRAPRVATAIGLTARDHIARHYSFDRMVRAFEHLYVARLDAARSAAGSREAA